MHILSRAVLSGKGGFFAPDQRTLYQKFETLLQNTTADFKRYLYEKVSWESRMIGIIGTRCVGKTN